MSELPDGWAEAAIRELNRFQSKTVDPALFPNETFELYSVPIFPTRKPEFVKGSEIGSTKQLVKQGDVLVCKINPRINRVWQVMPATEFRQIASSEWIVIRSLEANADYLMRYFSAPDFRELICDGVTGVGGSLTRAQPANVATFPVLLAPLNEQKRIADKLDALLARVDACRERLDRVPALLKRFRQAVLAAATSGKLTEEWRESQPDSEPPKLARLGDHVTDMNYGTSAKSAPSGLVPVLRMGNIQDGRLDWKDLVYTSDRAEVSKYRLAAGDVLFNRTNSPELVGKTAIFSGEREAIFAGYLIRFRCTEDLLPKYIGYCLTSPEGREYCWRVKSDGVSQSNINAKKLAAFEYLMPTRDEQAEIVRRVENLFTLADRLEAKLHAARHALTRTTPALLAKAFRGELVPQDPADEPADVLLARVRATLTPPAPLSRKRTRGETGSGVLEL